MSFAWAPLLSWALLQVASVSSLTLNGVVFDGNSADEHVAVTNVATFSATDCQWVLGDHGTALMVNGTLRTSVFDASLTGTTISLTRCGVTGGGLQLNVLLQPTEDVTVLHTVSVVDSSFTGQCPPPMMV